MASKGPGWSAELGLHSWIAHAAWVAQTTLPHSCMQAAPHHRARPKWLLTGRVTESAQKHLFIVLSQHSSGVAHPSKKAFARTFLDMAHVTPGLIEAG